MIILESFSRVVRIFRYSNRILLSELCNILSCLKIGRHHLQFFKSNFPNWVWYGRASLDPLKKMKSYILHHLINHESYINGSPNGPLSEFPPIPIIVISSIPILSIMAIHVMYSGSTTSVAVINVTYPSCRMIP